VINVALMVVKVAASWPAVLAKQIGIVSEQKRVAT
jgi:hypothetical protein